MARNILYIGDRNPSLFATLVNGSGAAIDLTGYNGVTFGLRRAYNTANSFKASAVPVTPASGLVRYDFGVSDLVGLTPGIYWGQWVATDASGKPEHISAGYFELRKAV